MIDGRLHRGRSRLAGEIGHLHVDDDGQLCHCGGRWCFWHSGSIPALLDELAVAYGRPFVLDHLADVRDARDADLSRALRGFGRSLGQRLADGLVFLDPDLVVIDGGLGRARSIIVDGVRRSIDEFAPPAIALHVEVVAGRLGADAQLVGAARLAHAERLLPGARL